MKPFGRVKMYRIACVLLLLFASVAHAQHLPSQLMTFGWDCVKEELDLVEGQSLKGRDQALRKELNYTVEWFDGIVEDHSLSEPAKMAMVKEVSDRYTEEKSKWLDEILLPHQLERLEQCRYWLAFKLRPTWVLQDHVKASNSSLVEVQAVYDEYFREAIELHREYRVKKAEVYEKNLKKSELEQLVKLGDKPKLDTEDREWIRRVIIPKVRDDMAELNEKLQEGQQKLFNLAQMKMLDCLTSAERTRWHKLAGVRVEFPTHPNEIIERIGNDKYSPDGRGKNLRPYTPRRPPLRSGPKTSP